MLPSLPIFDDPNSWNTAESSGSLRSVVDAALLSQRRRTPLPRVCLIISRSIYLQETHHANTAEKMRTLELSSRPSALVISPARWPPASFVPSPSVLNSRSNSWSVKDMYESCQILPRKHREKITEKYIRYADFCYRLYYLGTLFKPPLTLA